MIKLFPVLLALLLALAAAAPTRYTMRYTMRYGKHDLPPSRRRANAGAADAMELAAFVRRSARRAGYVNRVAKMREERRRVNQL